MSSSLQHFPDPSLRLLSPDYEDDSIFSSFPALRLKTLHTLYETVDPAHAGAATTVTAHDDKSPKGSVDEHIRSLVNLINHHPSYATLSSCSGRLSLFDPQMCQANKNKESSVAETGSLGDHGEEDAFHREATGEITIGVRGPPESTGRLADTGKGSTGGWRFVSHDLTEPEQILQALDHLPEEHSLSSYWTFKMEPMLMHVAACNVQRGQQLLQIALAMGYRESGLVVTDRRVTVAIRSYSRALVVPIFSTLPESFLRSLVKDANARLQANWGQMHKLQDEIQRELFRLPKKEPSSVCLSFQSCLPDLNLWGHAMVAIPAVDALESWENASSFQTERPVGPDIDLLTFGGYGSGPAHQASRNETMNAIQAKGPSRCSAIFRLGRRKGRWGENWTQLAVKGCDQDETTRSKMSESVKVRYDSKHYFNCCSHEWTPVEGLDACSLLPATEDKQQSLVLLFGGRAGPAHPFSDLILFDLLSFDGECAGQFCRPLDVRGCRPLPRWGHTLTALHHPCQSDDIVNVAVLVGGRDAAVAFADVFILSVGSVGLKAGVSRDEKELQCCYFQWATLETPIQLGPRFHHATAITADNQVFVFGGIPDPTDVFGGLASCELPPSFCFRPSAGSASIELIDDVTNGRFGHSIHTWVSDSDLLCITSIGGLSRLLSDSESSDDSVGSTILARSAQGRKIDAGAPTCRQSAAFTMEPLPTAINESASLGAGPLVHHRSISLSDRDIVSVGGGVAGFAFAPCYARCTIIAINDEESDSAPREIEPAKTVSNEVGTRSSTESCSRSNGVARPSSKPQILIASSESPPELTRVLFILKAHAKRLKSYLESKGWLDKRYRMSPVESSRSPADPAAQSERRENVDPDLRRLDDVGGGLSVALTFPECIAVPITKEGWSSYVNYSRIRASPPPNQLDPQAWMGGLESFEFVQGSSERYAAPYSTGMFATGKKRSK
jgi:tRNA wybutosine-synthesizing protein 3